MVSTPDERLLVLLTPAGKRGFVGRSTPIAIAAQRLGVEIPSVCGGKGRCGRCKVKTLVLTGAEREKLRSVQQVPSHLIQAIEQEGFSLACQAKVEADTLVLIRET